MSFYKRDGDEMLVAPNFVYGPGFTLLAPDKDSYTYPVDGWTWCDSLVEAEATIPVDAPEGSLP